MIDVAQLPEDVVALIDALGPGDNLVVTRDGNPVATIASIADALGDDVVAPGSPDEDSEQSPDTYPDVTVVVTAMKLSATVRASLSAELGANYIVLDLHAAPATADVLLLPPVSPQLVSCLGSRFPKAKVVVAEFEDADLGVTYHGPVRRMLDAGAEVYLASTTIPRLATQLDHVVSQRQQITGDTTARLEIEPSAVE
jgi:antitoxin (DNA-binding transcriptional repressor) of toxin-antitoxin stability system